MIRAKYYGRRARKWIYKKYRSWRSFKKARIALGKKRRIRLKQTRTPYFRRRRW